MSQINRLYQFLINRLSNEEIDLIMQSRDNIPAVITSRVIYSIKNNTKRGKYAIQRIRHKGQKIFRRTNRN